MGIAATALGDWPAARRAWTAAGVRVPPGDGAIQMDIGATPCRAVITSVPRRIAPPFQTV